MVTCTGHIGIHEGADGRTYVHDVMAIKPNFLTSMGYHIFLSMVLRARAPSARAELRYYVDRHVNARRKSSYHDGLNPWCISSHNTLQNKRCFL